MEFYAYPYTNDVSIIINFIKIFIINLFVLNTSLKISNYNKSIIKINLLFLLANLFFSYLAAIIKQNTHYLSTISLIIILSFVFYFCINNFKFVNTIIITAFSLCINFIVFFLSTIISYLISVFFAINNDSFSITIIIIVYFTILYFILKINRFKYGITFLKNDTNNEHIDIIVLNLSIIFLVLFILLPTFHYHFTLGIFKLIIALSFIMIITIYKSFQMYYKHNLLVKELNDTKSELEKKNDEITKLEQENLELNKKNHSIAHKQKALEHKINEIIGNIEISSELSVIENAKEISKDLTNNIAQAPIPKIGIEQIDDMLSFMQYECIKNNIVFDLQLNGNIFHMINTYISKEKLEILLADHIKNAIIAINSSDNINRSILVKLGIFEGIYSIYFYDSGIEFEKETLENLGKMPITTHKDTGGTGFGFMNTFDTLKECNASIEINHIGPPSKDNYTKCIIIKFDNEHKIKLL